MHALMERGHALQLEAYVHMKIKHAEHGRIQYKKVALYGRKSGQGVIRNEENCKCTFNLF